MSPPPRPSRAYWACQLGGWGLYTALNAGLLATSGRTRASAASAVSLGLLGLLATHWLRGYARRRGWAQLGLGALAPRVLGASLALALATQAVQVLGLLAALPDFTVASLSAWMFAFFVLQFAILLLLWQVLYFGVHAAERGRRAELDRLAATAEARTAELRALRSQLNPHFLFNALNSVRALITLDPPRAQEAVTRLSSLLRYTLAAGEAQTVPLARELEVVADYLALEGLRFEERLRVRLEVPPACLQAPVPVMLVQTLVENAVKHGIARCAAGGELRLTARREPGALALEVANPSPGPDAPAGVEGTGLGLGNARERLRLLCGEEASLALDASGPQTVVSLRIPWA